MLTRAQKEVIVNKLGEDFKAGKVVVFGNYQGSNNENWLKWRKNLPENFQLQVIKNSLLSLAGKAGEVELSEEILGQPIAALVAEKDEVEASKIAFGYASDTENYKILGGVIGGKFINPDEIIKLAKLPNREILEARLVGNMRGLLYRLTNALAYNGRALASVLRQIAARG